MNRYDHGRPSSAEIALVTASTRITLSTRRHFGVSRLEVPEQDVSDREDRRNDRDFKPGIHGLDAGGRVSVHRDRHSGSAGRR